MCVFSFSPNCGPSKKILTNSQLFLTDPRIFKFSILGPRLHILLSPYLCFISFLYLVLYVQGDNVSIN